MSSVNGALSPTIFPAVKESRTRRLVGIAALLGALPWSYGLWWWCAFSCEGLLSPNLVGDSMIFFSLAAGACGICLALMYLEYRFWKCAGRTGRVVACIYGVFYFFWFQSEYMIAMHEFHLPNTSIIPELSTFHWAFLVACYGVMVIILHIKTKPSDAKFVALRENRAIGSDE